MVVPGVNSGRKAAQHNREDPVSSFSERAAERRAAGKQARQSVPLEAHAEFLPPPHRDPVGLLLEQGRDRVPELVPVRHARMLASPFTFYRGAALVMAADLAGTLSPGLRTQLCGDAHLSNFGAYASPERRLVFDINDFDETLPGPFEWDVKRLAASVVIAGEDNEFDADECRKAALSAVRHYREAMRDFAQRPMLEVWYAHLNVDDTWAEYLATLSGKERQRHRKTIKARQALIDKARSRTSLQAIAKLTEVVDGRRRLRSDPPLMVPLAELTSLDPDEVRSQLTALLDEYSATLQTDRRRLLDHYTLTDIAHRVVGVGSVGTRAWVILGEGEDEADSVLLQAKQAHASVLAAFVGASEYDHQGQRVVAGQRLMQAASDIFLGWVRGPDTLVGQSADYYVRQLRDRKVSLETSTLGPDGMALYARLCGWTLARAHARAGDRLAIAAYLGKSSAFDEAIADFAQAYARQNQRDHAALLAAVQDGRVQASLTG